MVSNQIRYDRELLNLIHNFHSGGVKFGISTISMNNIRLRGIVFVRNAKQLNTSRAQFNRKALNDQQNLTA